MSAGLQQDALSLRTLMTTLEHLTALGVIHQAPASYFGNSALAANANVVIIQRTYMYTR
jgi:hypothetical protein